MPIVLTTLGAQLLLCSEHQAEQPQLPQPVDCGLGDYVRLKKTSGKERLLHLYLQCMWGGAVLLKHD